jgi:hypothetical protein
MSREKYQVQALSGDAAKFMRFRLGFRLRMVRLNILLWCWSQTRAIWMYSMILYLKTTQLGGS